MQEKTPYGVFGGSFDPVHNDHLAMAHAASQHLHLEEVLLVPNRRNPLRRDPKATPLDRLEMLRLAIEDQNGLAVSDIEISRPGPSYTVETLEELQLVKPGKIWILLGADALDNFMSWNQPEKITRLARLAVFTRPGHYIQDILDKLSEDINDAIDQIPVEPHKASSTLVRDLLARGLDPDLWLPPKVWDYIQERGLYRITETQ